MADTSQAAAWPNETDTHTVSAVHTPQQTPGSKRPLFPLGKVVATPGALELLDDLHLSPLLFLVRHVIGDWGDLDAEDQQANQAALVHGYRLLSSYRLDEGHKLWLITEADRSVTTLLLPEEY